jgi:hypothetical protein
MYRAKAAGRSGFLVFAGSMAPPAPAKGAVERHPR